MAEVDNAATHEGTMAELLERWTAAAEWEPSTQATVRWATRCHLVPHLGHLPVAKLTAAYIERRYARDEVIYRFGDPGDEMLVIASGRVRISKGGRRRGAPPAYLRGG